MKESETSGQSSRGENTYARASIHIESKVSILSGFLVLCSGGKFVSGSSKQEDCILQEAEQPDIANIISQLVSHSFIHSVCQTVI